MNTKPFHQITHPNRESQPIPPSYWNYFAQIMARGKPIPETTQWIIIQLSTTMSVDDIAPYTSISPASIRRILKFFKELADVNIPNRLRPHLHNKSLCDYDIAVSTKLSILLVCSYGLFTPASTPNSANHSWSLSWWVVCRSAGDLWSFCIRFHNLEDTQEGRVYYEEGELQYGLFFIFLTCLQLSRVAIERSTEKRADFGYRIGTYEPQQLVFVDESTVDRRTTYRNRAWAIRGRKATCKAFFCRGRRSAVFYFICLLIVLIHP